MAVSGVVLGSRLLLRFEIQKVFHYSMLGNFSLINRCSHIRTFKGYRKFTTSLVSKSESKENEKVSKTLKKQSSSSSSSSSDSDNSDSEEDGSKEPSKEP